MDASMFENTSRRSLQRVRGAILRRNLFLIVGCKPYSCCPTIIGKEKNESKKFSSSDYSAVRQNRKILATLVHNQIILCDEYVLDDVSRTGILKSHFLLHKLPANCNLAQKESLT